MRRGGRRSILERVYLSTPTPSPLVYWNHRLSAKTGNNILESTTCGQNLELKGLRGSLKPQVVSNQPTLRSDSGLKSSDYDEICCKIRPELNYLVAIPF